MCANVTNKLRDKASMNCQHHASSGCHVQQSNKPRSQGLPVTRRAACKCSHVKLQPLGSTEGATGGVAAGHCRRRQTGGQAKLLLEEGGGAFLGTHERESNNVADAGRVG